MPVEFKDNSLKVKAALNEKTIAWLHEAAGEIESQTKPRKVFMPAVML